MARRRKSPWQKALHAMAPHRVLWRAVNGDEIVKAAKPRLSTTTKMTPAARQKKIAAAQKKAAAPAKKAAAKKTVGPYATALAIPGQNRATAAKQAKATQPVTAEKRVVKRNAKGQWDGSTVMPERDLIAWQRAQQGHVDPALRIRNSRTRRG